MYVSTGVELLGVKDDKTPHDGLLHLWLLLTASAADLKCELPQQFSNLSFEFFLGSGTFGDVFAGRTKAGDGAVAVKIFKRQDIWMKERNVLKDIQTTLKKQHAALVTESLSGRKPAHTRLISKLLHSSCARWGRHFATSLFAPTSSISLTGSTRSMTAPG